MNLGQANDAYDNFSDTSFNAVSEFQIGWYVDSQCFRWRHLALVRKTSRTCLHLSKLHNQTLCHFGCVFAYACLLTLVECSLYHRLLSRPTWWIFLTHSPSLFAFRLTSPGSNGSVLCGRAPPRPPSSSRWRRRTPSCAASVAAWRQTCWVCGGGTRLLAGGRSGSFGGEMTPTLPSSSTMTYHVRLLAC